MFDGDTAGKNAAHKALTVILPQLISTVNIQFVFLPEGKDPDSFIQSFGLKSFNKLIHQATPMSEFIFNLSSHGCNQNIAEGRAKLIKNLLSFFKIMSEGILKNQIILEASNRFGFFNNELNLKRYNSNHVFKKNNQSTKKNISSKKIVSLDIRIFKTLTRYPALLNELELLIKEIDESEPEIFSDIQKNAIIFVRENSDFNQNPDKNLFLLKEIIPKSDNLNEEIRSLLEKSCEVDLAIDDISKYDIDSAKLDLKFMLKRLVINHLEMEASRIINTGESFDKLLEVRNKISELTLNKTV